jgi:hypothetical protein
VHKAKDIISGINRVTYSLAAVLLRYQVLVETLHLESKQLIDGECTQQFEVWSGKIINLTFKQVAGHWYLKTNDKWHQLSESMIISIPIMGTTFKKTNRISARGSGLISKIKHYWVYEDFLSRCFTFLLSNLSSQRQKPIRHEKNLPLMGGLTFRANCLSGQSAHLTCLDFGGIYSTHLNTEGLRWPDQVAVGYYSTEYASYAFYQMFKETGNLKWKEALERSLRYFINTRKPYKAIAFDHLEFKLLPLLVLFQNLKSEEVLDLELLNELGKCLRYEERQYSPVNVFAMRIANLLLADVKESTRKEKVGKYLHLIEANQTTQGLIRDNYPPAYKYSVDLTYHQFSLACLSLAYMLSSDQRIGKLVSRALAFSRYVKTPQHHVSYYGRGANNIYHLAAYIFAESIQEDPCFTSIIGILDMYAQYTNTDIGLPSALNRFHETRMGWNHCNIPYIGQTLFFLLLSKKALRKERQFSHPENVVLSSRDEPDFLKLRSDHFELICGRGGDTYSWSDGVYLTGCPGIVALNSMGQDILASTGYNFPAKQWVCDVPLDLLDKSVHGIKTSKLKILGDKIHLNYKDKLQVFYSLEKVQLVVRYQFSRFLECEELPTIPFRIDPISNFHLESDTALTLEYSNFSLRLTAGIGTGFRLMEIERNPFGRVLFPHIKIQARVKSYHYKLEVLAQNPVVPC